MIEKLNQITNNFDKYESNISICLYDYLPNNAIEYFEEQLVKIKKIANPIKKKNLNDKLFKFINYLKSKNESLIINSLFFINDEIFEIKLNNKQIQIAKEYKLHNPYYITDSLFMIEYFIDYFCNINYIIYLKINKLKLHLIKFTKYKQSSILKSIKDERDIEKEIENYKNYPIYIYGLKNKLNFSYINLQTEMTIDELLIHIDNENMKKNHQNLENRLIDLKNEKTNIDLYVFGKLKTDIKEHIESYLLKELYIEEKKLDKLKSFVDFEYLNFKIFPIKTLIKGDIGEIFIRDYNGIMGIKYY